MSLHVPFHCAFWHCVLALHYLALNSNNAPESYVFTEAKPS
jgi:hypothetical protein